MAAYAALVSLTHIIEQIQQPHVTHLLSPPKKQIESIHGNINFFQQFLQGSTHKVTEIWEGRIADAARAAENVIESWIVDQIVEGEEDASSNYKVVFPRDLEKVMQEMEFIKTEVITKADGMGGQRDHEHRDVIPAARSSRHSTWNMVVGSDDDLSRIMDRLIGQGSSRQIIPIIGMGGIGKTTLAKNVYDYPSVAYHFDIRAWITISQEYNVREICLGLLYEIGVLLDETEEENSRESLGAYTSKMGHVSEYQLGEHLYKHLIGRRYLIIMDDMWNIEAWDEIKLFLPDTNIGSRIMITTRLSNVANCFGSEPYKINFLDVEKSWSLLCKKVFARETVPPELEQIGKKIAKDCKGLPLSIVVIGGLLSKLKMERESWEYVAEDVNTHVKLEDDEHCLRILYLSYSHLPVHLKPCFLYMGIFPEDRDIQCSKLIKHWVAEGFLKPIGSKTLEEAAEEYLMDLIDRNLILVRETGCTGKVKSCKIHDLLRGLCLREAYKEKFLYVTSLHDPSIDSKSRLGVHRSTSKEGHQLQAIHVLESMPLIRSLVCNFKQDFPLRMFRLLRLMDAVNKYSPEEVLHLVNLRYLAFDVDNLFNYRLPSSMFLLWNLQTIIINTTGIGIIAPSVIWKMPQLRHVKIELVCLPDPVEGQSNVGEQDNIVLKNLQTLETVKNFKCSEEVCKRIPNIKKLRMMHQDFAGREEGSYYCLNNLSRLDKLESLACFFIRYLRNGAYLRRHLTFPQSLKKLTLRGSRLLWSHMTMIGTLPCLQVLKLKFESFVGPLWVPTVGEFSRLKFLQIYYCNDLEYWDADSCHFPRLEQLVLHNVPNLVEIPLGIGDIATLQLIHLEYCNNSTVLSAKKILEEQESLGNEGLQVRTLCKWKTKEVECLASNSFQVQFLGGAQPSIDFKGVF